MKYGWYLPFHRDLCCIIDWNEFRGTTKTSFHEGNHVTILVSFFRLLPGSGLCCLCHRPRASAQDLGELVIFIGHRLVAKFYARSEVIPSPMFFINLLDSYHDIIFAFKSIGIE